MKPNILPAPTTALLHTFEFAKWNNESLKGEDRHYSHVHIIYEGHLLIGSGLEYETPITDYFGYGNSLVGWSYLHLLSNRLFLSFETIKLDYDENEAKEVINGFVEEDGWYLGYWPFDDKKQGYGST